MENEQKLITRPFPPFSTILAEFLHDQKIFYWTWFSFVIRPLKYVVLSAIFVVVESNIILEFTKEWVLVSQLH